MTDVGFVVPASAPWTQSASSALRGATHLHASIAPQKPVASTEGPSGLGYLGALGSAALAVAAGVRASRRRAPRVQKASVVSLKAKVGEAIPNIGLDKGFPPEKVPLFDYCKGKKVVLVGLPGAFTPT
mmetsp:Transcript_16845/g.35170  ORF Transcript_16845/g.35170 Transcript_16845/m.35170 type:complete len:128 (-) Transcript_16845:644-1027(-)